MTGPAAALRRGRRAAWPPSPIRGLADQDDEAEDGY